MTKSKSNQSIKLSIPYTDSIKYHTLSHPIFFLKVKNKSNKLSKEKTTNYNKKPSNNLMKPYLFNKEINGTDSQLWELLDIKIFKEALTKLLNYFKSIILHL